VIVSERGGPPAPNNSVVNWFAALYRDLDLVGCSSHSGRRTFVTRASRLVFKAGGSLRDVQQLAGHASIDQTRAHIEGNTPAKRRLVALQSWRWGGTWRSPSNPSRSAAKFQRERTPCWWPAKSGAGRERRPLSGTPVCGQGSIGGSSMTRPQVCGCGRRRRKSCPRGAHPHDALNPCHGAPSTSNVSAAAMITLSRATS
jgi:hypothetical protein